MKQEYNPHAPAPQEERNEIALPVNDTLAMVATLHFDLRGLRDRTILLLGYAGGLRRSGIVGLDAHKDDTSDSGGWLVSRANALLTLNAKRRLFKPPPLPKKKDRQNYHTVWMLEDSYVQNTAILYFTQRFFLNTPTHLV